MKGVFIFLAGFIHCFLLGYTKEIKILFLKEQGQEYVDDWIRNTLEENSGDVTIEPVLITLRTQDDDESQICSNLAKGASMMVDLTWTGHEEAEAIAIQTDIPYLQIDISISPFLDILDQYLGYRNSTDVALIFDNPDKIDESLYYWIDTSLLRMVISDYLDEKTAVKIENIRPTPNNIAIVASTENMTKYFQKALEKDLVKLPERWNLLFLDFKHKSFDRSLTNHTAINILYMSEETCCRFLKFQPDCQCPDDFNMQRSFFNAAMQIILKGLQQLQVENVDLPESFECQKRTSESQAIGRFNELLQQESNADELVEKQDFVLRPKYEGTIERGSESSIFTDIVATFNSKTGIKVTEGQEIKQVKPFFRIGITHALPWSFQQTDSAGNTYWTGYCVDFTKELAEQMNFDYEFVEPKTGSFGNRRSGTWNGVVGDLASGMTDMVITALIMTADREEVIDFVAPYYEQTGITIVMRKPVRKTSLFKFMTVLKLEVWLSIVGALIVTGFMIWFLDKYSPYSARNNKKAYSYPCREFSLKESFWFALTSFTPQGGGEAPKALSGRTLVAAYWLFVVLMLATFTANLAAFLTVERMQTPVQSLEQLAKQSRINYTVVKNSDTHIYFINMKHAEDTLYRMWKELTLNASTDDTQYRVWDYPIREQYGHILLAINDSNPVATAAEGFRIVDEHTDADFAFIHDSSEIKYEISRNCNLTEVGEVFAEKPYAVAVQQGSHLQDQISKTILNLQKDRFFEQLQSKYWNHSAKGSCPNTDDNEGITLESLGGVFIATLFGLALSMLTLVGEVLYYRRKAKLQKTKKKITMVTSNEQWKSEKLAIGLGEKNNPKPVTIGTEFKPVNYRDFSELTNIQLYPRSRNRIGQTFD